MKGGEINSTNLSVKFCQLTNTLYFTFKPNDNIKMYLLDFHNRCFGILTNFIEEIFLGLASLELAL